MLTESSRAIAVNAVAEQGDYRYKVDYKVDGKTLLALHCNAYKKTTEEVTTSTGTQEVEKEDYAGLMFQESGNKQLSFPDNTTDIPAHLAVFEEILSEVNASLNDATEADSAE